MSVDKIDKEYSYRYIEDNEGHPSIEILRDGTRETET